MLAQAYDEYVGLPWVGMLLPRQALRQTHREPFGRHLLHVTFTSPALAPFILCERDRKMGRPCAAFVAGTRKGLLLCPTKPSHYTCCNKKCISKSWVGDNDNDCGDNSDEDGTISTCHGISHCLVR